MEPITTTLFLTAAVDILTNRVDQHLVGSAIERARGLLASDDRPVNHDLLRATRRAYLLATKELCLTCLEEMGIPRTRRRRLARRIGLPGGAGEFDAVLDRLETELKRLEDSDLVWSAPEVGGRYELLLKPRGDRPGEQIEELKAALKARLLDELVSWKLEPPEIFRDRLERGWEAPRAEAQLDWFDLISLFFVEELKKNEQVERAFSAELLAVLPEAKIEIEEVHRQLEEYAEAALPLLERLDSSIAKLYTDQRDQFELLRHNLVEATEDVSGEVAGVGDAVRELRRLILLTTSSQLGEAGGASLVAESQGLVADYRWRGDLVAQEVIHLLAEYRKLSFVGREDHIEELNRFVSERRSGRLVVTAPAGYGKTALLANWIAELEQRGAFPVFHFFSTRDAETTSVVQAFRNLLRQLRIYHEDANEPPETREALKDEIHRLVRKRGRSERLVIVIDGLDEAAESRVDDPFGRSELPDGVYVVVSARADRGEEPSYLAEWATRADEPLHLGRLNKQAIAEWLQRWGDGTLAEYGRDEAFVDQMAAKTGGFPLHVHHLIEEFGKQAGRTELRKLLASTPKGFSDYVREQSNAVFAEEAREEIRNVFALLTVAKGPLHRSELKELTEQLQGRGMKDDHFADLQRDWRLRRWLHIGGDERGPGDEPYSFAQPFLAQAFAHAIGNRASEAKPVIRAWCVDWSGKRYALRHCADHLLEEVPEHHEGDVGGPSPTREELYALARDPGFRDAQLAAFPAEPDLPLRTLQSAILAAAKTDDAGAMAEFLLLHWQLIAQLRESPLEGLDLFGADRARHQADLAPVDMSAVWHLLIAWRLLERGALPDADATLEALARKDVRPLSGEHEVAAACALAELASRGASKLLVDRLLGDRGRHVLARQLVARARVLRTGDRDASEGMVQDALAVADRIEDGERQSQVLREIAADLDTAERVPRGPTREDAASLLDPETRASTLVTVARAEAAEGRSAEAAAIFQSARDLASAYGQALEWDLAFAHIRDEWEWRRARPVEEPLPDEPFLAEIERIRAWAARLAGNADDTERELERAKSARIDPRAAPSHLSGVAWAERDRGGVERAAATFARAGEAAGQLGEEARAFMLVAIASAAAHAGAGETATDMFESARGELARIDDPAERAHGFATLGKREATTGLERLADQDFATAMEAAAATEGFLPRVTAFLHVARCASGEAHAEALAGARRAARTESSVMDRLVAIRLIADEVSRGSIALSGEAKDWAGAELDPLEQAFYRLMIAGRQEPSEAARPQTLTTLRLAEKAARSGVESRERGWLLRIIGLALAELGAADEAGRAFRSAREDALAVEEESVRGVTLASLAFVEARVGWFGDALETIGWIENDELEAFALWGVATIQAERGLVREAVETLWRAVRRSVAISDVGDQALALVAIADRYGQAAKTFGSAQVEMSAHDWRLEADEESPRVRAAVLRRTAIATGSEGDRDLAAETLAAARDAAQSIESPVDRAGFLGAIAHSAATVRQSNLAETTFELALDQTEQVDDPVERAASAADIAWMAAASGTGSAYRAADMAARTAALEVDDAELGVPAVLVLASARALAGAVEETREALELALGKATGVSDPDERGVLVLAVARIQARVGLLDDAARALRQASTASRELASERQAAYAVAIPLVLRTAQPPKDMDSARLHLRREAIEVLLEIARAESELPADGRREETLDAARKLTEEIEEPEAKQAALDAIENFDSGPAPTGPSEREEPESELPSADPLVGALIAGREGDADKAIAVFSRLLVQPLPHHDLSTWALASIARAQARSGAADAAVRTAAAIADERARGVTLVDVERLARASAPEPKPPGRPKTPTAIEGARQAATTPGARQAATTPGGEQGTLAAREGQRVTTSGLAVAATEKQILSLGGRHFLEKAAECEREGDRDGFESNLVPCAYYPEVAGEVCSLLARVYPRQSDEVVAAVTRFAGSSRG